jgi:hypothetical protein
VKGAWNRDNDRVVVIDCYKRQESSDIIPIHAAAIKAMGGDMIPVAWPFDGKMGNKSDGVAVKELYRQQGLRMLWEHATFQDGGFGVEPSIQRLLERMRTGRWLVMAHLKDWFEEFRIYHRKNGLVVKERDDLMSASRYMKMMLRYAREPGGKYQAYKGQRIVYDNRGIV